MKFFIKKHWDTLDITILVLCILPVLILVTGSLFREPGAFNLNPRVCDRHDIYSSWSSIKPVINGRIRAEEWEDATKVFALLRLKNNLGSVVEGRPMILYVKNDDENLYLAIQLKGENKVGSMTGKFLNTLKLDLFTIRFDNDMDGIFESGEDEKNAAMMNEKTLYDDKHVVISRDTGQSVTVRDTNSHGKAALFYKKPRKKRFGEYHCEFVIPLNSDDPQDINMSPGQKIRFNVFFIKNFTRDMQEMSIGGLSGENFESASDWGYLTLSRDSSDQSFPVYNWQEN
jgi:hypothetical protein